MQFANISYSQKKLRHIFVDWWSFAVVECWKKLQYYNRNYPT